MAKAENVPGTDEKSEKKSAPSLSHNMTGRRLILTSYFRRSYFYAGFCVMLISVFFQHCSFFLLSG